MKKEKMPSPYPSRPRVMLSMRMSVPLIEAIDMHLEGEGLNYSRSKYITEAVTQRLIRDTHHKVDGAAQRITRAKHDQK